MQEFLTTVIVLYSIVITVYCLFLVSKVHKYKQLYLGSVDSIQRAVNSFNQIVDTQDKMFNTLNRVIFDIQQWIQSNEKEFVPMLPEPQVEEVGEPVKLPLIEQIRAQLVRVDKGWRKKLTPTNEARLHDLLPQIKHQSAVEREEIMNMILDHKNETGITFLTDYLTKLNNKNQND